MNLLDYMQAGGPGSGRHRYAVVKDYTGGYHVHKDGCAAAKKAVSMGGYSEWEGKAESPKDAASKFVNSLDDSHGGPGKSGYAASDVKIHNCTKK